MPLPTRTLLASALVCCAPACGADPSGDATGASTTADTADTAETSAPASDAGDGGSSGPGAPTSGGPDTGGTTGADDATGGDTAGDSSGEAGSSEGGDSSGGAEVVFQDVYPLAAEYPEGGTYDPVDGAFYVGSLGDGTLHRVDATSGAEAVVFTEEAAGTWWTLGMDVDVARRLLWVCAMDDRSPDPRAGYVWIFDLTTMARIHAHALADAAGDATCTDVALAADGRGYVGDRELGNVYVVDVEGGASLFTTSPALEAAFVGQNSMVVLPDQSALLSLLYLPSGLARVDLQDASVAAVDIDGTFSDLSPLAGADGMTLVDGGLYVAFTSRLARVTPTLADWSQAASEVEDLPSGMTDVVATPGGLYLLNGQSVVFALGGLPDPFALTRYTGPL